MNKIFALSDVYLPEKIQLTADDDLERLLGEIIVNRVVGIAYDNLDMKTVPKEMKKALATLKEIHNAQTQRFLRNIYELSGILSDTSFPYALLKGAYLTTALYKNGKRTSNDIDILINSRDISSLQDLLIRNGFVQGHEDDQKNIIPATRREILTARMSTGETIPFIKQMDEGLMEIDINFSVDFKPESNIGIVEELLNDTLIVPIKDRSFRTLSPVEFLIHLCSHLYKEATTYNWLEFRRDLMLYKFSDINVFLHHYNSEEFLKKLYEKIHLLSLEKECYYTFENSCIIYPGLRDNPEFVALLKKIRPDNLDFMKQIQYPMAQKQYRYHMNFDEWFACSNRIAQLYEC